MKYIKKVTAENIDHVDSKYHCMFCGERLSNGNWHMRHQYYMIECCMNCIANDETLEEYQNGNVPSDIVMAHNNIIAIDGNKRKSPVKVEFARCVLSRMFDKIEHIVGLKFICDGKRIQVINASKRERKNQNISWSFSCEDITDYYLCLGFMGAISHSESELEHAWLVPYYDVNDINTLVMSRKKVEKFSYCDKIDDIKGLNNLPYVARDNSEIAEHELSRIFGILSPVRKLSRLNFVCDGCSIHVSASSCRLNGNSKSWSFSAVQRPDYFLFLAFKDKSSSELEHVWLMPSRCIDGNRLTIRESMAYKWAEYDRSE